MDPTACLRRIDSPDRIDADARHAMADLAGWLGGGGFPPDWGKHVRGADRFLRVYPVYAKHLPRWNVRLAPTAEIIATVSAATVERAKRMAPKSYLRRAAGEIYAERVA